MRKTVLTVRIASTYESVSAVLKNRLFSVIRWWLGRMPALPGSSFIVEPGQAVANQLPMSYFRAGLLITSFVLAMGGAWTGQRVAQAASMAFPDKPMVWNAPLYNAILRNIHRPVFPNRDFNVLKFGAKADGKTDCALAFGHAIRACHAAGGGTVIVPKGTYVCNGPITLLSNVNFHLNAGSQINFGFNPADYLTGSPALKGCVLVRYEGVWCYNYSPLIYAFCKTNVAVTGSGVLNGQRSAPGSTWIRWYNAQQKLKWKDRLVNWAYSDHLTAMHKRIFGAGWHLMPEFCDFEQCRNVLVRGVTFTDTPFWTIHPCFSKNVIIEGVSVYNHDKNMDDGIDVDSCDDTLIQNCNIRNNDDNIVIKSGRNADAWSINGGRPSENIIIRHNWLSHDIGFGSEMSGGIKNVFEHDNQFGNGADIIYMKWGGQRGGYIKHIYIRGITADDIRCLSQPAIAWAGGYKLPDSAYVPAISDWAISKVHINRIESTGMAAIGLVNLSPSPIKNVIVRDIHIGSMGAKAPAVWLKNAAGIHFQNVMIAGTTIHQLHATGRRNGDRILLHWKPYPGAAGYMIYTGKKTMTRIKGGAVDHDVLRIGGNDKISGYLGIGAVLPGGLIAMREDVKVPVQRLPRMQTLRQLVAAGRAMLKKEARPVTVVPMHYTARQRELSHLFYCVHAGELVLGNSTATPVDVAMAEKMLRQAMNK